MDRGGDGENEHAGGNGEVEDDLADRLDGMDFHGVGKRMADRAGRFAEGAFASIGEMRPKPAVVY